MAVRMALIISCGSCMKNNHFKVIKFRRNFGQTPAMRAGFDFASGGIIITLDADLQNDPEDIPKILEKMDEGYDIVSGWRKTGRIRFQEDSLLPSLIRLFLFYLESGFTIMAAP